MTIRPLLRVRNLQVAFPGEGGEFLAVRGLDLDVGQGETLALVGESGCGKSVTALSLLGLVPRPGRLAAGDVRFQGHDLARLTTAEWRDLRGREIGMVFQEPMTSLNPVFTVGYQLGEALTTHERLSRGEVRERCLGLLREVGVPDPEARLGVYPGQLSGGLRQRVMIAIAVACRPKLLIADEPTTALDVTVQAQIMALLARLRRELGMSLLLITHDLGLVAQNVERVVVMYAGHAVEEAPTQALFTEPLHPYTRGLLGSMPGTGGAQRGARLRAIPGNVPHPSRVPSGCPFRDRCSLAVEACGRELPRLEAKAAGHTVRCIRVGSHV